MTQASGPSASTPRGEATYDAAEVARFSRIAAEWWDERGKFRPLHQLGPERLGFIRDAILGHFRPGTDLRTMGMKPLAGITILDVGCGGGLISEPLSRLGGTVTGLDPSPETIAAARAHAATSGLAIDYRAGRAEDLAAERAQFDCVCCLEVVEHVPDVGQFVKLVASLVRPGGLLVLSTLNRTMKSYMLAIVGAEYILRWLPVGTHQWERFVTPDELGAHIAAAGLAPPHMEGLVYDPLRDRWSRSLRDLDVNYLAATAKAG